MVLLYCDDFLCPVTHTSDLPIGKKLTTGRNREACHPFLTPIFKFGAANMIILPLLQTWWLVSPNHSFKLSSHSHCSCMMQKEKNRIYERWYAEYLTGTKTLLIPSGELGDSEEEDSSFHLCSGLLWTFTHGLGGKCWGRFYKDHHQYILEAKPTFTSPLELHFYVVCSSLCYHRIFYKDNIIIYVSTRYTEHFVSWLGEVVLVAPKQSHCWRQ